MNLFFEKLFFRGIIILLLFFSVFSFILPVRADEDSKKGNNKTNEYGLVQTIEVDELGSALNSNNSDIFTRIGAIIGTVLAFVGVLFLCLMIYGGFLRMTAGGELAQVEKAKNLIYSAIIGLIIVLSAYAITAFIGYQLTN